MQGAIGAAAASESVWDAVVVGAGPAGAVAAHELARGGAEVLLVDRSDFPRDKVCGACLSARTVALLARAGLEHLLTGEGALPIHRLELLTGGGDASLELPRGAALSRRRLDAALVEAATRAGARFLAGHRARLGAARGDRRVVRLPESGLELAARVVLAADGLAGGFLPEEVMPRRRAGGSRLGAWTMVAAGDGWPRPGTIAMAVSRQGYVGVVRVEGGWVNVGAALSPRRVRESGLGGAAAKVLCRAGAPAAWVEGLEGAPWRGTGPLTSRPAAVTLERVFVIGDSAGYVEPFTGEGMAWALESALAVAPVALEAASGWRDELASRWTRVHANGVGRRQRRCGWVASGLRHPWMVRAAVRVLATSPRWAAPLARRLGGLPARAAEASLEVGR